jgi:phosphoenolpyruvate-protein kinase (PTS system EI component)
VPASAVPEVKQACRSVSAADCRVVADKALAMHGAQEVKAYLRDQMRRLLAHTGA